MVLEAKESITCKEMETSKPEYTPRNEDEYLDL
jgi:hypothetical protein